MNYFRSFLSVINNGEEMKKSLVIFGLSLVFSLSAYAAPVFIYPICYNGPAVGECHLVNNTGKVIACNIQARGQTVHGIMINAFEYATLYQGMFASVTVYANNPMLDPLVYVRADAFCNTLN